MFTCSLALRSLVVLAGVSVIPTITQAQGFEVSGFGGGATMGGGLGTHATYGGSGAVRLGDHVHVFGEFSFATLLSETVSGVTATGKMANYGGAADYSFGSSESRIRPFVTAGLGVGHFYVTGPSVSSTVDNALYEDVGGGVRVYFRRHWGLKPEVKYRRYNSANSGLVGAPVAGFSAVQYTVGLFYGR
jgi:hypothetical protein